MKRKEQQQTEIYFSELPSSNEINFKSIYNIFVVLDVLEIMSDEVFFLFSCYRFVGSADLTHNQRFGCFTISIFFSLVQAKC